MKILFVASIHLLIVGFTTTYSHAQNMCDARRTTPLSVDPLAPKTRYPRALPSMRNPYNFKGDVHAFETRNTSVYWRTIELRRLSLPVLEVSGTQPLPLYRYDLSSMLNKSRPVFLPANTSIAVASRSRYYHNGIIYNDPVKGYFYQMIFVSPTGRETIAGWVSERDLLSPAPRANWLANPQARTEGDTQSCLLCTFDLSGSRQRSLEGLLEQFSTMNSILRDRHPMIEPLEPTQGGQTCPIPAPYAARRTPPYGMRTHPILRYQRMHSGVDFGVDRSRGAPPIVSAMGGKVIEITDSRLGYGYQVKIQNDDGTIATYSHFDRSTRCRAVQVNQRVEKC